MREDQGFYNKQGILKIIKEQGIICPVCNNPITEEELASDNVISHGYLDKDNYGSVVEAIIIHTKEECITTEAQEIIDLIADPLIPKYAF